MMGSYFATSQVMPASIQGYERNYKCAKNINCASVRPKVERADVSASALQSKYFAGASVMKNISPCRYYSSTRVAQAEETHSR